MTGVELISKEREEQVSKHGRTLVRDRVENNQHQLRRGALFLLTDDYGNAKPKGWDDQIWQKMKSKPIKEKLIIAGALIAAEIDRLNGD